MTTATLIERLAALPSELRQAEATLLELTVEAGQSKRALVECEDFFILGGLTGKNEQAREAQLRYETQELRSTETMADNCVKAASMQVRCLRDELSALRACARLLAGEGE